MNKTIRLGARQLEMLKTFAQWRNGGTYGRGTGRSRAVVERLIDLGLMSTEVKAMGPGAVITRGWGKVTDKGHDLLAQLEKTAGVR